MVATPWMRTVTRLERSLPAGAVFFSEALYTAKHPHLKGATIWGRTQVMGPPFGSVLAAGINDNLRLAALSLQTAPIEFDANTSLIGMLIVDPITGAMYNLKPEKIEQPLAASQAQVNRDGKGVLVVLASQTTEPERADMVRVN